MLGKLIKHEFIATWKYILIIELVTIILGIVSFFVGFGLVGNYDNLPAALQILLFMGLLGYIFLLFAAYLLTTVCNVVRYYRSLYTYEGYLTFTLPATTFQIISAKIMVALIWQLLTCICIILSICMFLGGVATFSALHGILDFVQIWKNLYEGLFEIFGFDTFAGIILYILKGFMQITLTMMIFFFAISVGQLFAKHKILGSIASYFVIRFFYGIISFIINVLSGTWGMLFSFSMNPARYFMRTTNIALVISIVASVAMYIGCIAITDKKLNLD